MYLSDTECVALVCVCGGEVVEKSLKGHWTIFQNVLFN